MDIEILKRIKEIYDPFYSVELSVYEKMAPFLEYYKLPTKSILKKPNEIETSARLILSGVVCYYVPNDKGISNARLVFYKGKHVFDMESYLDQLPTDSLIITKDIVEIVELTKENETKLFENVPEAAQMAISVNKEISRFKDNWIKLLYLPKPKAHDAIYSLYPNLGNKISGKDFQDILKIGKTSLNRLRSKK